MINEKLRKWTLTYRLQFTSDIDMKLYFKRVSGIIVVIGLVIAGVNLLNYVTYDDSDTYTRLMMHELYSQGKIDVVFAGASHCYRGINPNVLDGELSLNTFNVSSSSQTIDGSEAIVREALNKYDVSYVVLDVSYSSVRQQLTKEERAPIEFNIYGIFLVGDYLHEPLNRFIYLSEATYEDKFSLLDEGSIVSYYTQRK